MNKNYKNKIIFSLETLRQGVAWVRTNLEQIVQEGAIKISFGSEITLAAISAIIDRVFNDLNEQIILDWWPLRLPKHLKSTSNIEFEIVNCDDVDISTMDDCLSLINETDTEQKINMP